MPMTSSLFATFFFLRFLFLAYIINTHRVRANTQSLGKEKKKISRFYQKHVFKAKSLKVFAAKIVDFNRNLMQIIFLKKNQRKFFKIFYLKFVENLKMENKFC